MGPPQAIAALIEPFGMTFPPHWETEFGPYQWFHIAGYRDHMVKAGIFNHSTVKEYASSIQVPASWRQELPTGEWDRLAETQIDNAIRPFKQELVKGRLMRLSKAMRLDKACMAILCLDRAVQHSSRPFDIYETIRIRPALFVVDGFTMPVANHMNLLAATAQPHYEFLEELANGSAVTGPTAQLLQAALGRGEVKTIAGRSVRRRKGRPSLTPNRFERINYFPMAAV